MGTTSLLIVGGQVLTLFFQLGNYFLRSFDATRRRFLLLSLLFLIFNGLWLYFNLAHPENAVGLRQTSLTALALLLSAGVYVHFRKECTLNKSQFTQSLHRLVTSLVLLIVALGALCFYLLAELPLFTAAFIGACTSLVTFFALQILRSFARSEFQRQTMNLKVYLLANYLGLMSIALVPPLLQFVGLQQWVHYVANFAYLALFIAYITFFVQRAKMENELLQNSNDLKSTLDYSLDKAIEQKFKTLTSSERNVAAYILKGHKHQEIADIMSVSISTITSHASRIYAKTGCDNKQQFLQKFDRLIK